MNRLIKFRAWGRYGDWEDDGEKMKFTMVDGDSLCFFESKLLVDLMRDKEDEEYFMQFTGLFDKNGKEIYEGDIIKENEERNMLIIWQESKARFIGKYIGIRDGWRMLSKRNERRYQTIGDKFSNPELLNQ